MKASLKMPNEGICCGSGINRPFFGNRTALQFNDQTRAQQLKRIKKKRRIRLRPKWVGWQEKKTPDFLSLLNIYVYDYDLRCFLFRLSETAIWNCFGAAAVFVVVVFVRTHKRRPWKVHFIVIFVAFVFSFSCSFSANWIVCSLSLSPSPLHIYVLMRITFFFVVVVA